MKKIALLLLVVMNGFASTGGGLEQPKKMYETLGVKLSKNCLVKDDGGCKDQLGMRTVLPLDQVYIVGGRLFDEKSALAQDSLVMDQNGLIDLNFFNDTSVFNQCNKAVTAAGELYLSGLFSQPTNNVVVLKKRQAAIQPFLNTTEGSAAIDKSLRMIKSGEKQLFT